MSIFKLYKRKDFKDKDWLTNARLVAHLTSSCFLEVSYETIRDPTQRIRWFQTVLTTFMFKMAFYLSLWHGSKDAGVSQLAHHYSRLKYLSIYKMSVFPSTIMRFRNPLCFTPPPQHRHHNKISLVFHCIG